MKKLRAFAPPRPHPQLPPMTLGWTEFGIVALLVALILLLSGIVFWPTVDQVLR